MTEFFKRLSALFYRGRQSKAPRRVEQLQSEANLPQLGTIRWSVPAQGPGQSYNNQHVRAAGLERNDPDR